MKRFFYVWGMSLFSMILISLFIVEYEILLTAILIGYLFVSAVLSIISYIVTLLGGAFVSFVLRRDNNMKSPLIIPMILSVMLSSSFAFLICIFPD